MNQNWLVTVFFFVLLLVILYLAYLVISPFLAALAWAAILAIIVYPLYAWLLRLFKDRATLAALVLTVLITFLIVFPALRISVFLSQETVELAKTVRAYVNGGEIELWKGKPWVKELGQFWETVSSELAFFNIDLKERVVQGVQLGSTVLVSQVKSVAQNIFMFAVNFIIALVSFFFFLRDGKAMCEKIRSLLPMDHEHQEHLFRNIVNALFAVIHGALITAMIQGLMAGIAYWVLGVPFAILLGAATAFTALFPIGGSVIVWFPTCVYLFFYDSLWKGLILLLWGALIVGSVDNVVKPVFIGSRLRLPVLFLFFSILGGLRLFGVIGLILGPVLFALLTALLDLYMKEYVEARAEN